MSNKIGEEFEGIVSAITDEGITVQIFLTRLRVLFHDLLERNGVIPVDQI